MGAGAVDRRGKGETAGPFDRLRVTAGGVRTGKLFWAKKLMANMARDRFVNRALRKEGWQVVRVWEHELTKNSRRCLHRIRNALRNV